MQIEELPKLLKESEGIAHIRCGICLRIVMGKDEQGRYWLPSFKHTCWQNVDEIKVEKLDLRGRMGVLLTVREEVGKMTSKFIECENCEGSGRVEEECPESKQMIEVKCPDCKGSGKVKEVEKEEVEEDDNEVCEV